MQFDILTIFPEFFESSLKTSLLAKALAQKKLSVHLHNIRDFTEDKHHSVDDIPYGGGAGMVLKPDPVIRAIESIPKLKKSRSILLTPKGALLNQQKIVDLAQWDQLILVCGRYEGIDDRVRELAIDEEISIGDYILNGGEAAAVVLLDALVRLIPGVLGNEASAAFDSFSHGLLEYPQYTRPPEFRGLEVPKVLLSGHHKNIEAWRRQEMLKATYERRPDLLQKAVLTEEDETFLKELQKEKKEGRQ
ncbi:MAG: tRNA (guanosine(37)-N1)-methyltransferase TrmD [Deltaproteobacteria bacterium]|nr:tRNA (guanosine(37)-N1)-methyltransferase TrmD [Deltaproteobacteria bacterium]